MTRSPAAAAPATVTPLRPAAEPAGPEGPVDEEVPPAGADAYRRDYDLARRTEPEKQGQHAIDAQDRETEAPDPPGPSGGA